MFLGCSRELYGTSQALICLNLQQVSAPTGTQLQESDVYCCAWPEDTRYIHISPAIASKMKWNSRDIYISLKPAYREEGIGLSAKISRLHAASPERPYELPLPTGPNVNPWEDIPGFVLSDVQISHLPWTGSPPIVLLFKLDYPVPPSFHSRWMTVTLVICIMPGSTSSDELSESGGSSQRKPQHHDRIKSHYAVIQYYPDADCPELQSFVLHHSCEYDHLDPTLISEYPQWTKWPIPRKIEDVLSIRFRPADKLSTTSGAGPVARLEVDIFDDSKRELPTSPGWQFGPSRPSSFDSDPYYAVTPLSSSSYSSSS